MGPRMVGSFDPGRYLCNSKKVDISGLDLSKTGQSPLTQHEIHCLTYRMEIESLTVVRLRSVLSVCAMEDADTTGFLSR
jgi:hypothetical protein